MPRPKTAAKAPTAAKAAELGAHVHALHASDDLHHVPLSNLRVASENARAARAVEDLEPLAANIETFGLLSPLVCFHDLETNSFHIIDGRRRFWALDTLRNREAPPPTGCADWRIPCLVRTREEAEALSLSANTQRVALNAADEAAQWGRMVKEGESVETIARAFGQTERFVRQRLKLAALHPPILDALAAGEINLDIAGRYAMAEPKAQAAVWKKLKKNGQHANVWRVKETLKRPGVPADDAHARFVGEGAYIAAGGAIDTDLFADRDEAIWTDAALVERLALEKLQAMAAPLEAEGWRFVRVALEFPHDEIDDCSDDVGKRRKATPEEKARLAAIDNRLYDLEEIEADAEDEAAEQAARDETAALTVERDAIEQAQISYSAAAKKKYGAVLALGWDDRPQITRGVLPAHEREDRPRPLDDDDLDDDLDEAPRANATPAGPPLSAAMTDTVTSLVSVIAGRTLAAHPHVALACVTAALARATLFDPADEDDAGLDGENLLDVRATAFFHPALPPLTSDDAWAADRRRWRLAVGDHGADLEAELMGWDLPQLLELLAHCAGATLKVRAFNAWASSPERDQTLARVCAEMALDPADHFIASADFFAQLPGAMLDEDLAAFAVVGAPKTKAAKAAMLAAIAAEQRWTPAVIRRRLIPAGGDLEAPAPTPEPPAKPKRGRKAAAPAEAAA